MMIADGRQQRNNQPTKGSAKAGSGRGGDGNSNDSGNNDAVVVAKTTEATAMAMMTTKTTL